jgi:acetyl-CoA synthetase
MRRILRKVASGHPDDLGDVTTLSEPAIVEEIVMNYKHFEY